MRKTLSVVLAKALFLSLAVCFLYTFVLANPVAAKVIRWNIQSNLTPGNTGYDTLKTDFCEAIERMSGGQFKLKLHPVNSLFPIKEGLEAVGNGVVQMAMLTGGYYMGKLGPIATIEAGLPGAERNFVERLNFFYRTGFLELIRELYAKHGIYYLGPHVGPGWDIMSKVPLRKMDDFKGLKMRAYGIEAEWVKAMGGSTVFLPGSELYTALATGVVDAVRWANPTSNMQIGLHEVAKYYILNSPLPAPNNFFAINMDAWNALPDEYKALLAETSKEVAYITVAAYEDKASIKKMQEQGVEFIKIPEEEWAKMELLARKIWRKYAENDEVSAKAIKMLENYLKYLGR